VGSWTSTARDLGHRLRAGPNHLWQRINDWRLGIDTSDDPNAQTDEFQHQGAEDYRSHYQAANYLYLERIARLITRNAQQPLVFYDIGCGKGRAVCVMARHTFGKVVGVDYQETLCKMARHNAQQLRGRVATVQIVRADAASLDYSDGHVFFFFNPFGPPTMRAVLESIERSLLRAPRPVTVIYYNAVHEAVLRDCPWLEFEALLPTFSGVRVSFWRSRASRDGGRVGPEKQGAG
jgi:SAM-dependent methyltransferase